MKGTYYTMDDAYKIANFDKQREKNIMLESDNKLLKEIVKNKDKHYLKIIEEKNKRIKELEEENYHLKNKQISF